MQYYFFLLYFFSLEILVIVTYVDRSGLYCSTESLLDSLQRVTPYCVITGIYYLREVFFIMYLHKVERMIRKYIAMCDLL